ncbi:hypothetical protein [Paraliomyxa miuraensis]|uniref:hypothetical protein n=1 Tax=Paraliomyxa miuraensis TaxID=376150 RepID=UPI00225096AD|nr:hypothetical protein [Paraliomyxa miuraensis]MCX4246597.1 hypothetical protein [Paraliomyxa miuraensis]
MTDSLDADRRFVLRALACLLPTMACARTSLPPLELWPIPTAPVPTAVFVLGRQYLAAHPEENDLGTLRAALGLDVPEPDPGTIDDFDGAIRHDLQTRDVVELEGWQLSRTECRLYALATLTLTTPARVHSPDARRRP